MMKLLANLLLILKNIVIWCKLKKTIALEKHFQNIFREYEIDSRFNGLYCIDVESIEKPVVSMTLGKAAGVDGLMVEHIQYAHPVLLVVLKKLFNFMIECG